jgi:UDP-glucose:(glucosyl)LPS alpha-1,2-glucosyltransferase
MSGIVWTAQSAGSSGGTEAMARALERRLPADLLDRFQIHLNRYTAPPEPGKIQVLWCHIAENGHEVAHLAYGGWTKFQRIVFVSNWQAQAFINRFGLPWSRCAVLPNAIEPVTVGTDRFEAVPPDQPIRMVYFSAPNRGLDIVSAVFRKICQHRDDVELDVYSSFQLYGWEDRGYGPLFDTLREHPRASLHGVVGNEELRGVLAGSHVFGYPSTDPETSCLCLLEAMSAGLACVHPNFGALYETAANWTAMYQWQEDRIAHAGVFYQTLVRVIDALRDGDKGLRLRLAAQKAYVDEHYDWDLRTAQWEQLLRSLAG